MNNWYILRVKAETSEGEPDLYYYEAVEWLGGPDEPLTTDIDLDNDWDLFIPAGTFEIILANVTEGQADKFMDKVDRIANQN